MRFAFVSLLIALFVAAALAATTQKAVIVTYPDDTPHSVIVKAMDAIQDAGGVITHEYKLLKGFAARASAKTLETVKTLGEKYLPLIEDDSIVQVDGTILEVNPGPKE